MGADCEFIFIRLPVLREYLTKELEMHNLPFEQDIEVILLSLIYWNRARFSSETVKLFM